METQEIAVTEATPAVAIEIPTDGAARLEWQRSGKLPAAKEPSKKADSAPVQETPASQEETASASEAVSTQEHKSTEKRSNADTRKAQLNAEIQELLKTRDELKREMKTRPAESSPAPAAEKTEAKLVKPKIEDFPTWEKYEEAHDKYVDELTERKAQEAVLKSEQAKTQRKLQEDMQAKVDDARGRYPDYDEVIEPARQAIFEDKGVHPAVKAMVDASPVFVDLLYVIGKKPDDMARIAKLSKSNPIEAIREIVLLDALVREERNGKPKEVVKVPAKRVPTAPDPGYEASGTATSPGDVAQEAVKKNDFAAFQREQNRKDIVRRKGR